MKQLIIGLIILVGLSGCVFGGINLSSNTQLEIKFTGLETEGYTVFIDNSGSIKKYSNRSERYITWGGIPNFKLGSNPPAELTFKHTINKVYWGDYNNLSPQAEQQKINNYAQSLPPSAWRTYTLYPQQIIEQAKHIPPSDKPASQKPKHLKTTLTLTLYIDGNGNITQEIKKEYVKVGNPYA